MKNFFKNNSAVSQVVGYLLSLVVTTLVVTSSLVLTQSYIDGNFQAAASSYAEEIANRVADLINNVYLIKQQYPSASYNTSIEIPIKLVDRFDYYIELSNAYVFVNSTNGQINVRQSLFNISEKIYMDLVGKVYGSSGKLRASCEKSDYIAKIDFGTETSPCVSGYVRGTANIDPSSNWKIGGYSLDNWHNRTRLVVINPVEENLPVDYQVLVQLNDSNFNHDYYHNPNLIDGTDFRFFIEDEDGDYFECPFWIERWYPETTHTSRIWVSLPVSIPAAGAPETPTIKNLYLYYSYQGVDDYENTMLSGDRTFIFFDNFTLDSRDEDKWDKYESDSGDCISFNNGKLLIKEKAALTSKIDMSKTAGGDRYIIEAKVKSSNSNLPREASIFARKQDGTHTEPYKDATLFTSGYFNEDERFNLAISRYEISGFDPKAVDESKSQMDYNKWYRLRYIVNIDTANNNNDDIVIRYFYDDFAVDGAAALTYQTGGDNGEFGLCVARPTGQMKTLWTYFDWIIVRYYRANPIEDIEDFTALEEIEPTTKVYETESKDFYWDGSSSNIDSSYTSGSELGADFVYNDAGGDGVFSINGLDYNEQYSITFLYGRKTTDIARMQYKINSGEFVTLDSTDTSNKEPYRKKWISGEYPTSNEISITFRNNDNNYWNVCALTIERGNREITIDGGS